MTVDFRDLIDPEEQDALKAEFAGNMVDNPTAAQMERVYRALRRILAVGGQPFSAIQEAQAEARIVAKRRAEQAA